jgi:enamine deaminase RidA (YjgF/YER057c/UK114 family)
MRTTKNRVDKETVYFGVPWESAYGYPQAVKAGATIHVSGQLSHDEKGDLVGPAAIDGSGRLVDSGNMALQMQTAYENARRILAKLGRTLDDVVEEVIYVTDFDAAFAVAGEVRKAAYGTDRPQCASTIVGVTRLAFPEQLAEISLTAVAVD